MNNVEEFIKKHKTAFETDGPSAGVWTAIEDQLRKNKKAKAAVKMYKWLSVAAVFAVGFGLYFATNRMPSKIDVAGINPEFGKKEVRFASQIEEMKDSLAVYANENPELYQKFTQDLKNLDTDYEKLKAELPKSPNQLFVIKAMVKNREMQLQVLNQQLSILNQVNKYKNENTI